jgi:hypothetical protein
MPKFILDTQGRVQIHNAPFVGATIAFDNLDGFTQGYIEALFFTNEAPQVTTRQFKTKGHQRKMEEGTADGCLPCDVGFDDLAPETLDLIIRDCKCFQELHGAALSEAYNHESGYDDSQAGRDLWFTRCGHGVGFWDRGLGAIGDKLAKLCGYGTEFSNLDVCFGDDDKVYVS